MFSDFFDGPKVSLEELLSAREKRATKQRNLLENEKYPLLSVTMNIPGPVKNTDALSLIFEYFLKLLERELLPFVVSKEVYSQKRTGSEYYALVDLDAKMLKKQMVQLEETTLLGRLFDLDVIVLKTNLPVSISRKEIDHTARSCFVCQEEAKVCGRSKKHSLNELQTKIYQIVQEASIT